MPLFVLLRPVYNVAKNACYLLPKQSFINLYHLTIYVERNLTSQNIDFYSLNSGFSWFKKVHSSNLKLTICLIQWHFIFL